MMRNNSVNGPQQACAERFLMASKDAKHGLERQAVGPDALAEAEFVRAAGGAKNDQPSELKMRGMDGFDDIGFARGGHDIVAVLAEQFDGLVEASGWKQWGGVEPVPITRRWDGVEPVPTIKNGNEQGVAGAPLRGGREIAFGEISLSEPKMERGARAFLGFDGDGGAMFFGEETGVVKAQAGAFAQGFGGEERLENRSHEARRDAGAGVLDRKADQRRAGRQALEMVDGGHLLVARGAEGKFPALGHGVGGVEGEVDDDLLEFNGVGVEGELVGLEHGLQADAPGQHR